jgi:hypothetical protein
MIPPIRFLLFLLFSVTVARACSCGPPSIKIATYRAFAEWEVSHTPVIFAGKVEGIQVIGWPLKPVAGETVSVTPHLIVTFSAVHMYRGQIAGDVTIKTGLGGGDCGYDFERGESYLVFASKEEDGEQFSTDICSGTKLLGDAGTVLRLLRGDAATAADLADPEKSFSRSTSPPPHQICGKVVAPGGVDLSSVKVVFWKAGRETTTAFREDTASVHSDGSYCMDYLKPGKYLIGAIEENENESGQRHIGYYPGVLERSKATPVEVQANNKTARADFALLARPLYSVHGYLRGIPENSTQPVQIMLLSAVPDQFHAVEATELGPHGFFEIEDVPPGRYTIFAMTQNEDNALTFLSEGVDIDVEGNIEGFKLDYVAKK